VTAQQALKEAIKRAGSQAALARALGLTKQVVQVWKVAPAKHVARIERATGVSRRDLRPDLYPRLKKGGADLARYWQAQKALIDAVQDLPPEALGLTRASMDQYLLDISLPWLQARRVDLAQSNR
jgi:DNA-binding transcriptional regulator YdaS (Cro superfamily)